MIRIFSAKVLSRYEVDYFRCTDCGLIQTEKPYWLDVAYESAITDLDVGLVQRNLKLSGTVSLIIDRYFDCRKRFLDFAGGYGLFVRLMRDKGFDFYHHDAFCQNLFASYFSLADLDEAAKKFEVITAFEFFEHVVNPVMHCEQMLDLADTILFTTELAPEHISSVDDWWYFVPETGQHITFYSRRSLSLLAQKVRADFYTDGSHMHAITRNRSLEIDLASGKMENCEKSFIGRFLAKVRPKPQVIRNQNVSVQHDYYHIKQLLNS